MSLQVENKSEGNRLKIMETLMEFGSVPLCLGPAGYGFLTPIWNKPGYLSAQEEFFKKFGHSFDAEFYGGSIGDGFRAIKQLFPDEKHE